MDRTLILVKPDAFERGLTGEIIARFERKGSTIVAMKHMTVERDLAEQHYAEHSERPFFGELVDFITGGPLVALVLEGHEAVKAARQVIGATNPIEAAPGSIRGDYGLEVQTNLVHGSDSPESAAREIGLFFPELAWPAHPRLQLAAPAGDPRAAGRGFPGRGAGRRGAQRRRPARAGGSERAPEAPRGRGRARARGGQQVVWDGRAHGKPADEAEAERWLRELSGRGTR